jgi:hypothetical protein
MFRHEKIMTEVEVCPDSANQDFVAKIGIPISANRD